MPFQPIEIPPGLFQNGTRYQAKGRWYDGNLVRWHEGAMRGVGAWERFGEGITTPENLLQQARRPDESPWVSTSFTGSFSAGKSYFGLNSRIVEVTDDPVTAGANIRQTVGELPDEEVTLSVILEEHDDSTATLDIAVYDDTADDYVALVEFTWATGAATVEDTTAGSSASVEVLEIQDGIFRIAVTVTPDNDGNTGSVRVYPVGVAGTSPGTIIWHHAQFEHSDEAGSIIFTTDATVEQAAGRIEIDQPVLGMAGWRGNDGVARLALGTRDRALAYVDGTLTDITPSGFTAGTNKAATETGLYGGGAYGVGLYGEGDASLEGIAEAQAWQFDTFGQFLIAHAHSDGKVYVWELDTGETLEAVSGAPTDAAGIVVTPERFLFVLGADGDARTVAWADQQSLTQWNASSTNQAGDFPLSTKGSLLAGRRGRGETLLWTTQDLWTAQFIGGTLIYSFRQIGAECGPISRRAMEVVGGGMALWMGRRNFFVYDGHVRALPSEVGDAVFSDLNRFQASQIHCVSMAEFNEVWWFYPTRGSQVVDRYVAFNYVEGHWHTGALDRTAGIDRGPFAGPLWADRFGVVYQHEVREGAKTDFLGNELATFAESGAYEIGNGDHRMWIREIIPDERTLGEVEMTLIATGYPTEDERTVGPFTAANPTVTRVSGRQVRLRLDEVTPGWRFGHPRLDLVPAERR